MTVTLIENPAQIHMTIAAERSATGDGGQVASLPDSVDWVHGWQTFWAEIWVGAPDMPTLAAAGATVDLRYNTDYLTALEIEYGAAFPLDRTGTIGDDSGFVGEIGGSAGASAVSTEGYLLLARVRFASMSYITAHSSVAGASPNSGATVPASTHLVWASVNSICMSYGPMFRPTSSTGN